MSFNACTALVKSGDPDRYAAAQAAPRERRAALMAIYAFNLETARAPWASPEPLVAQMRLRWWGDEIGKIYQGVLVDTHQILPALREVIFDHNLPRALFDTVIETRHFDLYADPHPSRAAFDSYINATSGSVMELAAKTLGATAETLPVLRDFAYASGVANLLRAVPELVARGRTPLPDAPKTIVTDALDKLAQARQNRRNIPANITPALLAGWRTTATLTEAARRPDSIFAGLLEESPARKMLTLLWRKRLGRW